MTTRAEKTARRAAAIAQAAEPGEKIIRVPPHTPGWSGQSRQIRAPIKPERRLPQNTKLEVINGVTYEVARFGGYRGGRGEIVKVFRRTPEGQDLTLCSLWEREVVLAFIDQRDNPPADEPADPSPQQEE